MARPRNSRSLAAEAAFRARLIELGATLLEPEWLGSAKKHHVRCPAGHDAYPKPASVQQGTGICWECSGRHPGVAEAQFRARIEALGGVALYSDWRGANKPHHVRCREGHACYPAPAGVQQGQGICRACAGLDPAEAEASYRTLIIKLGGTPLWERWRGNKAGHPIRCPQGHEPSPRPNDVQQGSGMCRTCGGQDPVASEAKFLSRLAELGAVPLYEKWQGRQEPHRVQCAKGHICYPRPNSVIPGHGVCRACAGLDPVVAEAAFRSALATLGATPLYERYQGSDQPHRVRCASGHECYPRPSGVQQGKGICKTCSGRDPAASEARFLARLAELGAAPLYDTWMGCHARHRVRCAAGHECQPDPSSVMGGQGVCRQCGRGKGWDVFYVVASSEAVKFGITTGDPRPRLKDHRLHGYRDIIRLATGLPDATALAAEDAVRSALTLAGESPLQGREYFPLHCLALILDVADSWLIVTDQEQLTA